MTTFNPGDRVQWLGFVESNDGEPDRPIGTLGTVRSFNFGIPEVDWDGGQDSGTTWAPNIALASTPETPEPADPDTQELRERLIVTILNRAAAADYPGDPADIVAAAKAFEAYITGGTK